MALQDAAEPLRAAPGGQVRAARIARGLSLRSLARTLRISPATLSQIETGRTGLSVDRLGLIADALGTTVSDILDAVPAPAVAPDVTPDEQVAAGPPQPRAVDTHWREYAPPGFDPVLSAALEEFLAIGYHGATVRGIAKRCGLSVPGIYHHYTSKQQMLVTLMDFTMTDLLARAHAAVAEGRDPVERFCRLIENLVLYHTHRRELGFVGASEMRSFEPANRDKIADLRTEQQRMVDHEVEDAVRAGRFRADDPHVAARAVVTMCTALPTWWRPDGPLSPEQLADRYVGVALDMMRHRP